MNTVAIELSDQEAAQLALKAARLGIPAADLIRAVVRDLVSEPDEEFSKLAEQMLEKNTELYRRLA